MGYYSFQCRPRKISIYVALSDVFDQLDPVLKQVTLEGLSELGQPSQLFGHALGPCKSEVEEPSEWVTVRLKEPRLAIGGNGTFAARLHPILVRNETQ